MAKIEEAEKLERLEKAYPDIQKRVGRWNKVTYFTKAVNEQVTDFDARHNCGCCSDSPLEIWPFVKTENGNVYSDPPCFTVGERDYWSCHDKPYDGWDTKMLAAGIPEAIVDGVRVYFKRDEEEEEETDE
jgi:hypothetical protein